MFLATIALAQLIHACAPNVNPVTMGAVVQVESGGNSLALHDNTLHRSFAPSNETEAVDWANRLIALGHSVDIGLSQINSANLPKLNLSAVRAFEPCTNLHAGAAILSADYAAAAGRFGEGQYALRRALAAYNSGSFFADETYVNEILVAAGVPPDAVAASDLPRRSAAHAKGPVAQPSYTVQHTAGSPVVVIIGGP
jgi:type IV secretion system protein VirB1